MLVKLPLAGGMLLSKWPGAWSRTWFIIFISYVLYCLSQLGRGSGLHVSFLSTSFPVGGLQGKGRKKKGEQPRRLLQGEGPFIITDTWIAPSPSHPPLHSSERSRVKWLTVSNQGPCSQHLQSMEWSGSATFIYFLKPPSHLYLPSNVLPFRVLKPE